MIVVDVRSTQMARLPTFVARARYRRLVRRMATTRLLAAFKAQYPDAVFAEIGANDGHSHDPLHPIPPGWTGVMVEPQPAVFARLRETVGDRPGIRFVNAAVAAKKGTVPFFAPEDDTLGSLAEIEGAERVEVEAITFADLGLDRLDLLLIDTEGHDWVVLQQVDLRPRLIVYEHYHLGPADRQAARDHLTGRGYELLEEGLDTLALRPEDDPLTERFRRLTPAIAPLACPVA